MDANSDDVPDDFDPPAEPERLRVLEQLLAAVTATAEAECTGMISAFVDARCDLARNLIEVRWKGSPPRPVVAVLEWAPRWVRVKVRRLEWTRQEIDTASDLLFKESSPIAAEVIGIVPSLCSLQSGGGGVLVGYRLDADVETVAAADARISAALTALVGLPVRARKSDQVFHWMENPGAE